jgi:hypothetical protein
MDSVHLLLCPASKPEAQPEGCHRLGIRCDCRCYHRCDCCGRGSNRHQCQHDDNQFGYEPVARSSTASVPVARGEDIGSGLYRPRAFFATAMSGRRRGQPQNRRARVQRTQAYAMANDSMPRPRPADILAYRPAMRPRYTLVDRDDSAAEGLPLSPHRSRRTVSGYIGPRPVAPTLWAGPV